MHQRSSIQRNLLLSAAALMALAALAAIAAGCGGSEKSGTSTSPTGGSIKIDGSSTLFPMTQAAAELFKRKNPNVKISVGQSGTGGGFEKFCAGETDVSDASRPIEKDEIEACSKKGIKYEQLQVGVDGIAVVTNTSNGFVKCLTVDRLKKVWDKGSKVKNWNEVDPKFPNKPLKLYGPGTDSGTFDFFTDKINGEEGRSRSDYTASEDDNVLVKGVEGDSGGLGYFGFSYYEQNKDKLRLVAVNDGSGCVAPDASNIQDGNYKPLSRPLFIYPSDSALKRPAVKSFVSFYLDNASEAAKNAQLVPPTADQLKKSKTTFDSMGAGKGVTK